MSGSAGPAPASSRAAGTVTTRDLFGDRREILIVHGQETYRLRITRRDKLILTK